ncbi:MAG: FkbM family methyltransferase [Polyangiales bacterium]
MSHVPFTIGDLTLAVPARAASEAAFIYREIFERGCYLKHGVQLGSDAVVLDVGANIGLFSLYVARKFAGVRVHAFEPTPPIVACARENLAAHPNVLLHEVALGAAEARTEILFFPRAPGNSTLHAGDKREECDAMSRGFRMSDVWGVSVLHGLALSLLYPLRRRLLRAYFAGRFDEGVRHDCRVTTLDRMIAEARITSIDLLKIDVEGAEREVLEGLSDENLARVAQLVLEVSPKHKPWIETLRARLTRSGFTRVVVESAVPRSDYRGDVYPCVVFAVR